MKKLVYLIATVFILGNISCKKYLDINDDPNRFTSSTPELVLPQAIVAATLLTTNTYDPYGSDLMYRANAGGFSGFGTVISYDYTTSSFTGLWTGAYDNLNDLKYVKDQTAGKTKYVYFNAAARILTAYTTQLLVDAYNDVPYSDGLKGAVNISPKYDKGTDIYKDLAAQCDTAITLINSGLANTLNVLPFTAATDPMFSQAGPNMLFWKQLANTIKLRLIVRAGSKVTFNNTNFSADGFLATDAITNPGYTKTTGKLSPYWPWTITNTGSTSSRLPSTFWMSYYNGVKLTDDKRGAVTFRVWPNPPTNQLGNETNPNPPNGQTPNAFFKGTSALIWDKVGIQKGFDAGIVLMLAAESYFLQAEAMVRGIIPGDPTTAFNKGIEASFTYLYKDNTNTLPTVAPYNAPAADATAYRTANATKYIANFALALTTEQKIEAIITQKYLALAMIASHESFNEYRRTGYPKVTGTLPTETMASTVSLSTRPDKMPTRVLYPLNEFNTNQSNVPTGIEKFSSLIFWAK